MSTPGGHAFVKVWRRLWRRKEVFHTFIFLFDFGSAVEKTGGMNSRSDPISAGALLADLDRALDRVEPRSADLDPEARLEWVRLARRVQTRIEALTGLLTAEADQAQASLRTAGTPLASWLGMGENLTRREAAGAVVRARMLAEHPQVGRAASEGAINTGQAQVISKVLSELAPQLDIHQQAQAEQVMVGLASQLDSRELAGAAGRVLAQIVPVAAEELLGQGLQRAAELARRRRSLRFFREGASIRFDGSLPQLEGEAFIALVDAQGEARRRTAIEARDPLADATPEQRRADALIALLDAARTSKPVPGAGAARVIVKLDYDSLKAAAASAGIIGDGEPLSAGELRRACCDAGLVPVVLGSRSEVLDVGRESRLVSAGIRTALLQRDGGCVFPGCDVKPTLCEAHHITPWWAGGSTSLSNMALLCHHHHGVVEPAKFATRDQWEIRLGADGTPELLPPSRLDRERRPVRHRRLGGTGRLGGSSPATGDRASPALCA
jgi:hypothetical protein